MDFITLLPIVLGGMNVVQMVILITTIRSQRRKEKALAAQEEANSVEKTQDIYNRLTERMMTELETRDSKIEVLMRRNEELETRTYDLRKELGNYQLNCKGCLASPALVPSI